MKEQTMYDFIDNIVNVVYYKYFNYNTNPTVKQDLFQEGFMKAYELLNNGNYDPTMSLRNFIFTGVRNAMTNYMYHHRKESHVDVDLLEKQERYKEVVGVKDGVEFDIDVQLIADVCKPFRKFGDYFTPTIIYLNKLGIVNLELEPKDEELDETMLEAIITNVIWKLYFKELER